MKAYTETLGEAFVLIGKMLNIAMPNITDAYYEESRTKQRRFINGDVGDVILEYNPMEVLPWCMSFRMK